MHPVSGPSRAIMMVAQREGIELNKKNIDLMTGEQFKPEFVKLNPQHCVPTIDDNGFVLWESRAILAYLLNQYAPDSSLYPKNPEKRAVVDRMLYFDIGTLYKAQAEVIYPVIRKGEPVDLEKLEAYKKTLILLEQFLSKSNYVAGSEITIADFSILANIIMVEVIDFSFSDYPKITNWMKRMKSEIPSYEQINDIPLKKFKEYLTANKKV